MFYMRLGKEEVFERLLIAFSIIVCSFQGVIFNSIFEILNCDYFETETESAYFIHSYLLEACYTFRYNSWIYFFIIPTLIFYAVLLPLLS